ncbi:hypothetical protein HWV62_18608 [Athelia sp. TMB]|nr:hypothetical protein HWV62_18608 [Athelia sp. TMB]
MAELLGTFAAPSPAESAIVHERISKITADLSNLDTEIGRLEKILQNLQHNRKALQRLCNGHHNVLNPTRQLPVEVLGEIFIQLQHMLGGKSIAPTRVCRQWREVAIGTSKLWSCIKIPYYNKTASLDEEMVPIWLRRSSGQPLTIELGCHGTVRETAMQDYTAVHDAIISQSHRWKDVKLLINHSMLSFLQNMPAAFPMLRNLYISRLSWSLETSWLENFENTFTLRALTFGGGGLSPIPTFPWAGLTECTLMGRSYKCQDGYHILTQAVNLQTFVMKLDARSAFSPTPPNHISLSNLSVLDIAVVSGENSQDLFNLLTLPALTDLKVLERGSLPDPFEYIGAMILRSRCSLKKLSFKTLETSTTHIPLLKLFNMIPSLSELELLDDGAAGWNDSMMDLLTHIPHDAAGSCCPLPKLTSIKVSVHRNFNYEKFVEFLSSRRDTTTCTSGGTALAKLRTAALMTWDDVTASGRRAYYVDHETYEEFVDLRDSGLDLYFKELGRRRTLEEYLIPGDEEDDSGTDEEDDDEMGWESPPSYF